MKSARSARRTSTAGGIALAIALLAGVNYLGVRHWARGDWTKTRLYSLSETSKKIVAGLGKPVRVTVFMTRSSRLYQPVSELLNRYRALSPKIEVEFLDPERNPARAEVLVREFGVRQNTVVFRSGDRKKYVEEEKIADFDFAGQMGGAPEIKAFKGEEAFTSALLDITEKGVKKIYFSSGHGEPALDSQERGRGFAQAKQLLERENMAVASWESMKAPVPADAGTVVIGGPKTALLEPEAAALEKYLAAGGRALILLDPVLPSAGAPPSDLGLSTLLAAHGIKVGTDIVIDPANAVPMVGAETVIANSFGTHPIVRSISSEGLPVVFPLARSVSKAEKPPAGESVTMLVQTSAEGWGETSLTKLDEVKKDPADTPGPVSIALAVGPDEKAAEKTPKKEASGGARLVVVGNSRFAANGSIGNGGNANLFLNAVNWLAGQEKLVGIAPKTPEQASLTLTRSQVNRIGLFAVLGLPGLAVILGVWVWYRRRD